MKGWLAGNRVIRLVLHPLLRLAPSIGQLPGFSLLYLQGSFPPLCDVDARHLLVERQSQQTSSLSQLSGLAGEDL